MRPVLGGWQLDTDTGPVEMRHLVMTVPAPQAAALLEAEHSFHPRIADVVMAPCLTLMAAFPADVPRPFRSRTADDHPLAWISEDSSKPGRAGTLDTSVAQASAEWSAQRLEDTVEVIADHMLPMLAEAAWASGTAIANAIIEQTGSF